MDIQLLIAFAGVILTAIQTVVVIFATIFAIRQLKESVRARKIDVVERVFEYVSTSEMRGARRNIYSLQIPLEIGRLTEQQKKDIEEALLGWGRVGFLFELGLFDEKD